MAGTVVRAFRKQFFDFSKIQGVQSITVAEHINVAGWSFMAIATRVHSADMSSPSLSIEFDFYKDGQTDEDPGMIFTSNPVITTTLNGPVASPSLWMSSIGGSYGPALTIVLKANNGALLPFTATISMDLVLRNPD